MAMKTSRPSEPLKIGYASPTALHINPNNSRTHSKSQTRKIAASIREHGFIVPILVDDDDMILAGHGRLEASKLLNLATVPIVRVTGLSEAQRRAFMIADNKLGDLSRFDEAKLATEFRYLLSFETNLSIHTGFDAIEVDRVVGHTPAQPTDGDEVELPAGDTPVVSQMGDLWIIGDHKLLNGNALERASWDRLLGNERIVQTVIDAPYNVEIPGNVSGLGKKVHENFAMACGEMSDSEFTYGFLQPVFKFIRDYSTRGAIAHLFMDWRHARHVENAADGVFFEHKNTCIWVKSNAGLGAFYKSQHEFVLVFKVTVGKHINNMGLGGKGRVRSNVWQYPGANVFRRGRKEDLLAHATVKNKDMIADALLDCSAPGDIVLDCFAGSGTLLLSAAQTGRRARAMEISSSFVDIALKRLMKQTGLVARLEDGRTFFEVALDRGVVLKEDA